MKDEKIKKNLMIIGGICIILSLIAKFVFKSESALYILYYPFHIVGEMLRYLSLSSNIGNILSIIIYIGICLIPMITLFVRKKNDTVINIDYLLIGLSAYMFYALYNFINPMELYNLIDKEFYGTKGFIEIGKLSLSMIFYIILISYLSLRALNSLSKEREDKDLKEDLLFKNLKYILFIFLMCYTVLIFYFGLFDVLSKIGSKVFLFSTIKYLVVVLPMITSMMVIYHTIKFIDEFKVNQYGEEVIQEVVNISEYGKKTVYLCVFSSLFTNITQLVFWQFIGDINMLIEIPFIPLIVAFLGMILAKYFKENKDLFDDNNSII